MCSLKELAAGRGAWDLVGPGDEPVGQQVEDRMAAGLDRHNHPLHGAGMAGSGRHGGPSEAARRGGLRVGGREAVGGARVRAAGGAEEGVHVCVCACVWGTYTRFSDFLQKFQRFSMKSP